MNFFGFALQKQSSIEKHLSDEARFAHLAGFREAAIRYGGFRVFMSSPAPSGARVEVLWHDGSRGMVNPDDLHPEFNVSGMLWRPLDHRFGGAEVL